jgi:hypothetical protein
MTTRPGIRRTLMAGLAGGVAFVLGTFGTFALLGGSREGETGLLFDPDTQHPKVIDAWKEIEPLPRVIEQPAVILAGMVAFALAYAFLCRSVAAAWPPGVAARARRLAVVIWIGAVFAEFMGPFNVLHQPLYLSVLTWSFLAVPAAGEALAIAAILERPARMAPTSPSNHSTHEHLAARRTGTPQHAPEPQHARPGHQLASRD